MRAQILELHKTARVSAHSAMFERLFELYGLFLKFPSDMKSLWPHLRDETDENVRLAYLGYAIIDLLYLMHLEWDTLDAGLRQTWNIWASRLVHNEFLDKLVSEVENEYSPEFINRLKANASNEHAIGGPSSTTRGGR